MNVPSMEQMKQEAERVKKDYNGCVSVYSKQAISRVYRDMTDKIRNEEARLSAVLERQIIDGVEIEIPYSMREYSGFKFHVHEGILYLIDRANKLTKDEYPHLSSHNDTEFHWHSYAWIPNGPKFSKLCVRMLGGDSYGDRAFAGATHYRHPADQYGYMETHLQINSHFYRPYIEHILQEVTGWTLKSLKQR